MRNTHSGRWQAVRWLFSLWLLLQAPAALAAEYRPLPPTSKGGLSSDWLIHDAPHNRLALYLADYHKPTLAYYQWVAMRPGHAFPITFAAPKGLSLFLDNRLVFTAATTASYTLDLVGLLPPGTALGPHLLCVWHPQTPPNLASFANALPVVQNPKNSPKPMIAAQPLPRGHQGQNVFLCFLLLIGLLYGSIRAVYQTGFERIYHFDGLWSKGSNDQDFLTKPTLTWLNLLLVVVFSLSFALLLVAIHTNIQSIIILRRLFDVPESAIIVRVLFYAALIAAFVLGKYLFLEIMGYIFDVAQLVIVQYREFMRTILFMGLFLPGVMLLYLGLNQTLPETVLWVSNGVVSLMLIGTVIRIGRTLHQRVSLLNLHLFSYLCATEVIPLIILLKLIVFTY